MSTYVGLRFLIQESFLSPYNSCTVRDGAFLLTEQGKRKIKILWKIFGSRCSVRSQRN